MENYIQHHGVKGQKWGVRRYQNKDGSLTAAGKKRQEKDDKETSNSATKTTVSKSAGGRSYNSPTLENLSENDANEVKRQVIKQKKLDDEFQKAMKEDDPETARKRAVVEKAKLEDEYARYSPEGQAKAQTVERLGSAKEIASNTATGFKEGANLANQISRFGGATKKAKEEARTLSDAELRNRINRINLEQQYKNLHPSKVARGAAVAGGILSAVGSMAVIAGAGIGIAKTIKDW